MGGIVLKKDNLAQWLIRFLLIFQLLTLPIAFIFIAVDLIPLALLVATLTLFAFISVLLLLYLRFRSFPLVIEKQTLIQKATLLQTDIKKELLKVQEAKHYQTKLASDAEKELNVSLQKLQQIYIQNGLKNTFIGSEKISGIGPKLSERLATYGITTAFDINNAIERIDGFGASKSTALLNWRSTVYARFDRSKPVVLPDEQLNSIKKKYQVSIDESKAIEKNSLYKKANLEREFDCLQPRLDQLKSITFQAYLQKSMSDQGILAAIITLALVVTQCLLGGSTTLAAVVASIPTATLTPTITKTPTITLTFTPTITSTVTNTPTITSTPTKTNTPTLTALPSATSIPTRITFPTASPIPVVPQYPTTSPNNGDSGTVPAGATAICNDGTYSFSQHHQGTCSHHGGVAVWLK